MSEPCNALQREILDGDWDRARLDAARRILDHLDGCEACRAVLEEYDELRSLLKCPEAPAPIEPRPLRLNDVSPTEVSSKSAGQRRRGGPLWSVAMAVTLLIAAVGWSLFLQSRADRARMAQAPQGTPTKQTQSQPVAQVSQESIDQSVEVFGNVSNDFDGQAGWVLVSSDSAELGLRPAAADKPDKLMVLRLVLTHGDKVLSDADLVIVPGEAARFSVPLGPDRELLYEIAASDTESSLLVELRRPDLPGEALAALATTRKADPGQIRDVGRLVANGDDYKLAVACTAVNTSGARP
ncbi:MAG: hypothetical protein JW818_07010 [Pirellulales bacterium]|nr:hypothetical protein [Pirellulales bacterium]